jgi:hypothetical protein
VVSSAELASLVGPLGEPWELTLRVAGVGEAGRRDTHGWLPIGDVLAELPARYEAAVARDGDPRRQAADLLPWSVAVPAAALVLPAVLVGVLPVVDEGWRAEWSVHEHPGGWLGGVALPERTVGRSHPAARDVAASVVTFVDPWLRRHCAALPITVRTAWGGVVDSLTGCVLAAAREGHGVSQDAAWRGVQDLVDELERLVPLPGRPRRVDVPCSAGTSIYPVRSTCCLHYRTHSAPDRDGDGYCVTCPLRTDASRRLRLTPAPDGAVEVAS